MSTLTATGRPRCGCVLSPEQRRLADALQARAQRIRDESEDGISIAEAVDLAAVQLGLQAPAGDGR